MKMDQNKYQACIHACLQCITASENCITECLRERDVTMLAKCIELNRECSVICSAAVRLMSMDGKFVYRMCELCAEMCELCAAECEKHYHIQHCKDCAKVCLQCARACYSMFKEYAY